MGSMRDFQYMMDSGMVAFFDEFFKHAKWAMPWIGRGFYLAVGFMFAMGAAHKFFVSAIPWMP